MGDTTTTTSSLDRTAAMSPTAKVGEAMRRSLPRLPDDAKQVVLAMLEPASLAIIAGTLVVWAGSHLFGVGEIVDMILLGAGVIALGFSVFDGARELYAFAEESLGATSNKELDQAAGHFAEAVTILGISAVQAVLLRGQSRVAAKQWPPEIYPRLQVGTPPPAGNALRLSRPATLPEGNLGSTDAYGSLKVSRAQSMQEQRITLYHELVHRYFSPRTGPLRKLRAELNISGYERSALLRYLEEALADGYSQLRVRGLGRAFRSYRWPIDGGYMTVSDLRGEGHAIGTIILGGSLFYVSISLGSMPREKW